MEIESYDVVIVGGGAAGVAAAVGAAQAGVYGFDVLGGLADRAKADLSAAIKRLG